MSLGFVECFGDFPGEESAVGGGVNRFAGTYKFSPQGVLSFPAPGLITTRMAGPPEIMDKERAYLKGLAQATRAVVARDALQLQNEDGATVMVFEQVK